MKRDLRNFIIGFILVVVFIIFGPEVNFLVSFWYVVLIYGIYQMNLGLFHLIYNTIKGE